MPSMSEILIPLRFHHIEPIRDTLHTSPLEEASIFIKSQVYNRKDVDSPEYETDMNYYRDVIGELPSNLYGTTTYAELYMLQQMALTLKKYIDLPNKQKIKLISTGKDLICFNCAVGEHCTVSPQNKKFGGYGNEFSMAKRLKKYAGSSLEINVKEKIATIMFGALKSTLLEMSENDMEYVIEG
jgi:hypothetical protein